MKIQKTKNYNMFKNHESNRAADPNNLRRLKQSIMSNNMLEFRPILVDKDMNIIDGHHRWLVAKELDLDIFYQVKEDATHVDIAELNSNLKQWDKTEFCDYYCSLGVDDYRKLRDFAKKHSMSISEAGNLLNTNCLKTKKFFNEGKFKFPDKDRIFEIEQLLAKVDDTVHVLKSIIFGNNKFVTQLRVRTALMSFLVNPEVDIKVFHKKLQYKCDTIGPRANVSGYFIMFRDIYNWKNSNPIA